MFCCLPPFLSRLFYLQNQEKPAEPSASRRNLCDLTWEQPVILEETLNLGQHRRECCCLLVQAPPTSQRPAPCWVQFTREPAGVSVVAASKLNTDALICWLTRLQQRSFKACSCLTSQRCLQSPTEPKVKGQINNLTIKGRFSKTGLYQGQKSAKSNMINPNENRRKG